MLLFEMWPRWSWAHMHFSTMVLFTLVLVQPWSLWQPVTSRFLWWFAVRHTNLSIVPKSTHLYWMNWVCDNGVKVGFKQQSGINTCLLSRSSRWYCIHQTDLQLKPSKPSQSKRVIFSVVAWPIQSSTTQSLIRCYAFQIHYTCHNRSWIDSMHFCTCGKFRSKWMPCDHIFNTISLFH